MCYFKSEHVSRKTEHPQLNLANVCLMDRDQAFSKTYQADRAGNDDLADTNNLAVKEATVSSLSSKPSKSASTPVHISGRHNSCNRKLNIS